MPRACHRSELLFLNTSLLHTFEKIVFVVCFFHFILSIGISEGLYRKSFRSSVLDPQVVLSTHIQMEGSRLGFRLSLCTAFRDSFRFQGN